MTKLPLEWRGRADQRGYTFQQLKRELDVVLLEKTNQRCLKFYEVAHIKTVPETRWPDGKVTPEREILTSSSEWGSIGWSPGTLERAVEVFNQRVEHMRRAVV